MLGELAEDYREKRYKSRIFVNIKVTILILSKAEQDVAPVLLLSEKRSRGNRTESPCPTVPISGTHDPEMGTATILSETLFGRTRGAVLAVLYGHIGESFYLRQLSRRTGISLGPVRK